MILHQLQRNQDAKDDGQYDDNTVSKAALLIAEQLIIETNTSYHLKRYENLFFKFNDEEYLRDIMRVIPEDAIEYPIYSRIYTILRTLKKQRITQKVPKQIAELRKFLTQNKAQYKIDFEKFLAGYKCMELYQFYNSKKLDFIATTSYNESGGKEDHYIEYTKQLLCNSPRIPVLMMNPGDFPGITDWETWKQKQSVEQLPQFLNCVLFHFPDISELTYQQLNLTRESILKKIKDFNIRMNDLHNAASEMYYESKNWELLRHIMREKFTGSEKLQPAIDEEVYIQRAKNTGSKVMVEVNAGITSLETLAGYYEKSGMLKPYVAATLKERIGRAESLTRCGMYYNFRVVRKTD